MTKTNQQNSIPYQYLLCIHRECSKANSCIRQLAEKRLSPTEACVQMIRPEYLAQLDGECPYYRLQQLVRYGKGFRQAIGKIPLDASKQVAQALMLQFGRRQYYYMRNGDWLISPKKQQIIKNIFTRLGIKDGIEFDTYCEQYLWED